MAPAPRRGRGPGDLRSHLEPGRLPLDAPPHDRPTPKSRQEALKLREASLRPFVTAGGSTGLLHALPALKALGLGDVSRLPVSLRMLLESLLRHLDGDKVTAAEVQALASWRPQQVPAVDVPFPVARVLLQDYTGMPLLCDLAMLRDTAARFDLPPEAVEMQLPVDLVIDHSIQVDHFRHPDAMALNLDLEFSRNAERYRFLKWGQQAFRNLRVLPPGQGICHQINLERLAPGVHWHGKLCFPDSVLGTDSHTTMINALGVLGWGVGGLEAEAAMLGQALRMPLPEVVGVHLSGRLRPGSTATDLVLTLTERLRHVGVQGRFVEFFGDGAATLTLPDRATVANMAPEYGATTGFFPPDEETARYLLATGRTDEQVDHFRSYMQAQQLFGMPGPGDIDYTQVIKLNLADVHPSVAGPGRPQDRISLPDMKRRFASYLRARGVSADAAKLRVPFPQGLPISHGAVFIAAITSCTSTANPGMMIAAGLLAQRATERGLRVPRHVKTSLAPGSRAVTAQLSSLGLLAPLQRLGFRVVGYGCTTCIGNSGPLDPAARALLLRLPLVGAAVLSGNRNFEGRIHPDLSCAYLMSPALVVAFALAGRVDIDLTHEPLGLDGRGLPVFLHELWPEEAAVAEALEASSGPQAFLQARQASLQAHPRWDGIAAPKGPRASWPSSTYIARPPFLDDFERHAAPWRPILQARALLILGDSVSTDHISPAGGIGADSPAGAYLHAAGLRVTQFNAYGARRGHHEVMVRGCFANPRLRNHMLPPGADGQPVLGGLTLLQPGGRLCNVHEAAMAYRRDRVPLLVFAGHDYGGGSSRDWAAKGTAMLGCRAVIARSFERIHRTNLIGMGVLPLQFDAQDSVESLGLRGDERFDLEGADGGLAPRQKLRLCVTRADGETTSCWLTARIDSEAEATILRAGGMLPHVMRQLLSSDAAMPPVRAAS